jgi:hypothetical protein
MAKLVRRIVQSAKRRVAKGRAVRKQATIKRLATDLEFLDRQIAALESGMLHDATVVHTFGEKSETGRAALERRADKLEVVTPLKTKRSNLKARIAGLKEKP